MIQNLKPRSFQSELVDLDENISRNAIPANPENEKNDIFDISNIQGSLDSSLDVFTDRFDNF